MTKRITTTRAIEIANSWGSMITISDPGAIMYSLPPLTGEVHRRQLLTHIDSLIQREEEGSTLSTDLQTSDERIAELQALRHWVSTATVPVDNLFLKGYVEAALWSTSAELEEGDDTSFQDAGYTAHDIHPDTYRQMVEDCMDFLGTNPGDLERYMEASERPLDHAGHDFWLTRNGHGCGWWDRTDHPSAQRLTDNSYGYGSFDLYVGEDGYVHGS